VVPPDGLVLVRRLDPAGFDSDSGGELRLVEVTYPRSVTVALLESTPLEQSLRSMVLIVNLRLQWRSLFESVTQPVNCGGCDATPVSRKVTEIIGNDASTDDTQTMLDRIGGPRVTCLRHEHNRGSSAARNTGIDHAAGEYVAFLDADDERFPKETRTPARDAPVAVRRVGRCVL
jgi:cellulose synthase/poly-beta-1,6-N-acetylglucosamine synthase-like glycosyltransferase